MNQTLNPANENFLPWTEEMILVPVMSRLLARLPCNATKPAFRECERSSILEHQGLVFDIKNLKPKEYFLTKVVCQTYVCCGSQQVEAFLNQEPESELHGNGNFYSIHYLIFLKENELFWFKTQKSKF